jgi:hypothetical protein
MGNKTETLLDPLLYIDFLDVVFTQEIPQDMFNSLDQKGYMRIQSLIKSCKQLKPIHKNSDNY